MKIGERLRTAGEEVAKRTVGLPVYGMDGNRVASLVVKGGKERLVYRTSGRGVVDHTDESLDKLGTKGGGNAYLNLAAEDITKIGRS